MKLITSALLLSALLGCSLFTQDHQLEEPDIDRLGSYDWPDPTRYEEAIAAFESEDQQSMPPEGALVVTGSSSIRGWHADIQEDLSPLTIIPRGFGGSNMHDLYHYLDRLVLPYEPEAVMIYEGDNDIAQGLPPEAVMDAYKAIKYKLHSHDPSIHIYLLSVKPSPSRWSVWPEMQETNRLFQEEASSDSRVTYIDIASPMLNEDGKPKSGIFLGDDLHMNRKGYELWRDAVRDVLFEKAE